MLTFERGLEDQIGLLHHNKQTRRVDYSFLPSSKNFPLQSADKSYFPDLLKNKKKIKTKTLNKKQSSVKNNTFYSLYLRQTINWWKGMRLDFISYLSVNCRAYCH